MTVITVLAIFFASASPVFAEYVAPGHHQHHAFYKQIQAELGVNGCCDDESRDCGPVADYVDLMADGTKVLMEDNQWHLAQTRKFYVDTPDGRAHVCRQPVGLGSFSFYCIFLPNPSI